MNKFSHILLAVVMTTSLRILMLCRIKSFTWTHTDHWVQVIFDEDSPSHSFIEFFESKSSSPDNHISWSSPISLDPLCQRFWFKSTKMISIVLAILHIFHFCQRSSCLVYQNLPFSASSITNFLIRNENMSPFHSIEYMSHITFPIRACSFSLGSFGIP